MESVRLSSISFQVRLSPAQGWVWGPVLCVWALLRGPEVASQSSTQRLWGHLWPVCPILFVSCVSLGYSSVCWTSRARVSVTLCPHPVYEAMGYLEEPGLGNQTESCSDPQLCHSHRLGGLRHVTAPFEALVFSPVA